jgi:uncharacterized protein YkwD
VHTALLIFLSFLPVQSTNGHSYVGSPAVAGIEAADPEILVLVELVSRRRSDVGCEPLTWHEGIAAVAVAHSLDMQQRDFYDHVDPDGETLIHRLTRAGIAFNGVAGENLVIGTVDGTIAYTLWIDSAEHRANIENCAFTHHGVGLADGRWTHVFVQRPLR